MKKNFSKLLARYLPYILLGLAATNFGEAWRLAEGREMGDKILSLMGTIPAAFANPLPSLHPLDILVGICCGAGLRLAVYCDSVGFQQVPEFLRENPLRTAELSTEQNENMIDGVLNNAPSLGELEAKAKAGEQISLTDLAAAVKVEEKTPKAKKSRPAKPKKPSIRAQLDAAKKEQSKQTPPREKTKELEV